MRVNDAISGAVLVIFAAAEIAYTRTFPSLHGQSYGPDLFPALIGVALALCGMLLIFRGLLARRNPADPNGLTNGNGNGNGSKWVDVSNIADSRHARINALLIIVFLFLYITLSDLIGFIPISLCTIAFLLYRLGSSIIVACTIAIVATAVIQLLFAKILLVPLPAGLLKGFL